MSEIIEIIDSPPVIVEISEEGTQGPAGAGMVPVIDQTLMGNASGSLATPTALNASQVREILNVPTTEAMQSALGYERTENPGIDGVIWNNRGELRFSQGPTYLSPLGVQYFSPDSKEYLRPINA